MSRDTLPTVVLEPRCVIAAPMGGLSQLLWNARYGPILPKIRISTRAIFLWEGESGRLDPRVGAPISMRDSNRGRGDDDYPVELYGDHITPADKCRGTMATRIRRSITKLMQKMEPNKIPSLPPDGQPRLCAIHPPRV